MSFEVFRRHQRELIAVFGLLAMISFVLSDSLPRLLAPDYANQDTEIATVFGRKIHRSDLNALASQRSRANLFIGSLLPNARDPFGGLSDRELIDAMILEREADRLGMPADPSMGRELLQTITQGQMNQETFNHLYARFSNEVSPEQLLADIANQVRLQKVRNLLGAPMVTPLDVYQSYRGQTERVSGKAIEIPVENFLSQVGEPSAAEIQSFYDEYKDVLPDPNRATPGFKIPRRVRVEYLSIDGNAKARGYRDTITEAELRSYYENHKSEFKIPSDLPDDLFADAPELTPPVIQSFDEVRGLLAPRMADERAQEEINAIFNRLRDEVLIPYADEYLSALDEQEEAQKQKGASAKVALPEPLDLKAVAEKEGINYETSPLLSRQDAERYGAISSAEVGTTRLSGGRRFADEFFGSKTSLYDPVELTDILGTRFLARKVEDEEPRAPALDEVKSDVIAAWKEAKARPLAEKAAQALAAKIKEQGGKVDEDRVDDYRVITIPPITRTQMGGMPASIFGGAPEANTPIPDVPAAGDEFRAAYFDIQPGAAAVAANEPKTDYYVIILDRREPASFAAFYAPTGEEFRFKMLVSQEAAGRQDDLWMTRLREQAGVKPDWIPPDEAKKDEFARS